MTSEQQIFLAIGTVVITAIFSFITSLVTARVTAKNTYTGFVEQAKAELQKEYETRFNERKWDVYLRFVKLVTTRQRLELLTSIHLDHKSNNEKREETQLQNLYDLGIHELENEIFLIGSKEVVEKFVSWRDLTIVYTHENEVVFQTLYEVINAMRVDLGKEKSTLNYEKFFKDSGDILLSELRKENNPKELQMN